MTWNRPRHAVMSVSSDSPARCWIGAPIRLALQMRADLWAEMPGNEALRTRWAEIVTHQRTKLRSWIESGARSGELAEIPANALAAILLSLGDGLMLHARLDPRAFRWQNIGTALDGLLRGVSRS